MPKILTSLRLEKNEMESLKMIAENKEKNCSEIVRELILDITNHNGSKEINARIQKLITQLEEPFAYVKDKTGKAFAAKERKMRELMISKLRELIL